MSHDQKLPICDNKESMKRGITRFKRLTENRQKPCKTMENIDMEFLETTKKTNRTTIGKHVGEFWLSITFKTPNFKEFEQKRYSICLLYENIIDIFLFGRFLPSL